MTDFKFMIRTFLDEGEIQYGQYEYEDLRREALKKIPIDKINSATVQEMRKLQKALLEKEVPDLCENQVFENVFFGVLARWFKDEFFEWVNSPDCENCGSHSKYKRRTRVQWLEPRKPCSGIRPLDKPYFIDVEEHECQACHHVTKFPRHTDCAILLETRKGRCAEWSYVFTLMLRALCFQVRLVHDATDHLWTEVHSSYQRRWMMIDSCEAVVDQPLLYERGWGKKLHYIIATGSDGPQDVAWRYSADHESMRRRRDLGADRLLITEIIRRRNKLIEGEPRVLQLNVMQRVIAELAELMVEPKITGELGGRTSGDADWIQSRSEGGSVYLPVRTGTIILIAREKSYVKICYSSATDTYCMEEKKSSTYVSWTALVFKADNIFRKVENDWKMAYLARKDSRHPGVIEWRFEAPTAKIETVEVNPGSMVKENGCITWELETDDNSVIGKMTNVDSFSMKLLNPSRSLKIRATLTSPSGSAQISWQHAQLFRESTVSGSGNNSFGFVFTTSNH